jgi:tetratricopeptide (TPR) repeat protein
MRGTKLPFEAMPKGDSVMEMPRMKKRLLFAVFSGVLLLAAPLKAPADEADLRQKALALNDVTGDDPIEGEIKALAADPAGTKKLLAVAVQIAKEKEQPFNYTGAYILARAAQQLKDLEAGKVLYQVCTSEADKLKSSTKLAQAFAGLISLLDQQKKYDEVEKFCQEFLEKTEKKDGAGQLESFRLNVLQEMIRAMVKQGKKEQALKIAENLVKKKPDHPLYVNFKGLVERELGKYEDAAKTWEDLLALIQKREEGLNDEEAKQAFKEFGRQIRLQLSNVYVDLNRIDKASEHLKALLAVDPDDPGVNNDLGYIWADHDMNLDEAEKMIRKALDEDRKRRKKEKPELKPEEDKDNAAYLDSLGWVLFKKKKFQEAKEPLLKAVAQEDGKHVEIYDHLGDIHMALGEKAEAIAIWKKGLELATEEKREKEIKTKVEKKLKETTGDK